ncbi:F-box/kelch-repeat protein At3g06240-like [Nicotiana tabacum]|uniref:F-box/kelch-repeat protein At3g06240-like n=1 Tax=Nicotiana tabacum TaxID=4097 RepID=A0A1S4CUM4_TOBAC|nr:PREDICTED: F-box/kelch-repeat protein At3g06240-like [Nicotiana tabacum]
MRKSQTTWCVGSANGLICLNIGLVCIPFDKTSPNNLCIWNPSIRKSKKLPGSEVTLRRDCNSFSGYGFGFDELHDDYKVVFILNTFSDFPSYDTKIRIYSLKTDSWRTVDNFQDGFMVNSSGIFVKGKLYWTSLASVHELNGYSRCNIMCFDLSNETWGMVEQPNYGEGKWRSQKI